MMMLAALPLQAFPSPSPAFPSGSPAPAAKPITGPWPTAFPAKELCSNCGLCLSSVGVRHVKEACAFLGAGMSRAESLEPAVHGRSRRYDPSGEGDLSEAHFGVHEEILYARGVGIGGAQWTGVTTAVALAWLEAGKVDAVVVAAGGGDGDGFAAPAPLLCRSAEEVLRGRRVKPSLCPSLAVLDEVAADEGIKRLLFCGVGCAVQALRSVGARDGQTPEEALRLEELFVLGTHCVDNSPTPQRALAFVAALPSVGEARAREVLAYEFMADFRVHARVATAGGGEETVKDAYMTLPPSIGVPSIADSCYSCFDYTNGLADLVVGYMGAPFERDSEMTSAPLMVTVRNARGRRMLEHAVAAGRVQILQRGGKGGVGLLSEGDRTKITAATFKKDSLVQTLTNPAYVAGDRGAPPLVGDFLARLIARTLPKGMEFARYSIDYHYLRNLLFVEDRMGAERAAQHVPQYAKAIMARYEDEVRSVRGGGAAPASPEFDGKRLAQGFQLWLSQFARGISSMLSQ